MENEPLIYTEQGIVYLFSRYWPKIDALKSKIKEITDAHTHFPDFYYNDNECGIEFEYKLSGFRSHFKEISKLVKDGVKKILVIYWEEDTDPLEIQKAIEKKGIKCEIISLKDHFEPIIQKKKNGPLNTYWMFKPSINVALEQPYNLNQISNDIKELEENGIIESLDVNKNLYRTLGWDNTHSDNIDLMHWKYIHFLTTTSPFREESIPLKILVKPKGYNRIIGVFEVNSCFKILRNDKNLKSFFNNYYFYEYNKEYLKSKCFIVNGLITLDKDLGKDLYNLLIDKGVEFSNQGSKLIEDTSIIKEIDVILERKK